MTDVTTVPAKLSYATVPMDQAGAGGMLAPKSLGEVVAFAQVMSRADIALPKHLRNNDGACMAVAMQAMRWEMDPFAVANKTYSVNDRLAFEAQLVAAVVHTRAPILRRPEYAYSGEGATRRCTISCDMKDGTTRVYESPTFGQITTKNSPLWKSDPDQQLGYFAIRSWARRHAPEVILGVYTPDEVAQIEERATTAEIARPRVAIPNDKLFSKAPLPAPEVIEAEVEESVDADGASEVVEPEVQAAPAEPEPPPEPQATDADDPLEWLSGARSYIERAQTITDLEGLNAQWMDEERWTALLRVSRSDHDDLLNQMSARDAEIRAAVARQSKDAR